MSVNSKMTALADEIRVLSGTTEPMGLDDMESHVEDANTNVSTEADLIAQIASALQNKTSASEPVLQSKTVTPTTSVQNVTPDSDYDGLSKVTVNAIPTATQATPSISVNSSGLITASATQTAGYVAAGTKSATKQLTTQAAKTITPSTSSQTAVASGRYTTGAVTVAAIPSSYVKPTSTKAATTYTPTTSNQTIAAGTYCSGIQTIKGDSNLKAENIAEGVSIFGVTGTHSGGSGSGGGNIETCTLTLYVEPAAAATSGNNRYCAISYCSLDGDQIKFNYHDDSSNSLINIGKTEVGYVINSVIKNSLVTVTMYESTNTGKIPLTLYIEGQHNMIRHNILNGYYDIFYTFTCLGDVKVHESTPCFVRGTLITLADNTVKNVCDINYNDELLVWDFDNGCYTSAKPLWIKKVQTSNYYYHCEFENGITIDLVGSDGKCHRLFNVDDNYFESATDCVGKNIMTATGVSKLIKCERIDEPVEFYNIITNYHLNLFANSILTSCRLNNLYPIENMKFVKDNRQTIPKEKYENIGDTFYYGLRLNERNYDDIDEIKTYVENLYMLMQLKEE